MTQLGVAAHRSRVDRQQHGDGDHHRRTVGRDAERRHRQWPGSWTLAPAQLSGLRLTPATGYYGTATLTLTATATLNGTTAETTDTMAVTLRPQVQSPSLSVRAVTGSENTAIPLTINASPARTETVTISISSVPTGAALSAGSPIPNLSGAWRLSLAELVGLTITPASGYTGTFTLGVVAAATLPGQPAAYTSAVLLVTVAAAI